MEKVAWALQGLGLMLVVGLFIYLLDHGTQETMTKKNDMLVRSPAFEHEATIPKKYTCDGEDTSPPLAIDGVSEDTESLAIIVEDPDAPGGVWDHWVHFNIPGDIDRIGEGEISDGTPGKNSWGTLGYRGPCPPNGSHRYLFKVYALNTMLTLSEGATKTDVLEALEGHVIESTTLMGRYERSDI
jgi:Raf kinase inhibitor-like YbhB/YbcL family protein